MWIYRFLRGKEKNISRDSFIWNTAAGLVNAAEAIVIMLIVTRTEGVEAAGMFSIAFAMGNLLMNIGKFGIRTFQVTDARNEYSFDAYYSLRLVTTFLMFLSCLGYLLFRAIWSHDSVMKCGIVACIFLIYLIESWEDVFLGQLQKNDRLDIASKIFIVRWGWILLSYSLIAVLCKNSLFAIAVAAAGSLVLEIFLISFAVQILNWHNFKMDFSLISGPAKQCLPLFLVTFLTYYITNAPKYAIDTYLTEDIQGYFGYISMPVFVIELLNCFLYQPKMKKMAEQWEVGEYRKFHRMIARQLAYILLLTILCVVAAYIAGIPVLSLLYGVDLDSYQRELILLMLAGGALAMVGFSGVTLTIQRQQKVLLCNTVVVAVLAFLSLACAAKQGGVMEICLVFLALMLVLAVFNYCCIMMTSFRMKQKIRGTR